MDIYHTKRQTENIPQSCSYLLLKTLFYFIAQCTSEPYLESKLVKELDNCNFTCISSNGCHSGPTIFKPEKNLEFFRLQNFGSRVAILVD